jgi:acyl phosphate:glycerol-3-phosphate acyltransferase
MSPSLPWDTFLVVFAGYLAGSVPFGVLFSRVMAGKDPRSAGSRNIGFTNVLRTAGRGPAALTLLGDLGKGLFAVWLARHYMTGEVGVWITGMAAVLGHNYPVFIGFRGGKGVATGLGVLYGIQPMLGWITAIVWGTTVLIWRYSSLGAIVAFACLPGLVLILRPDPLIVMLSLILTAMILARHRANIRRLLSGTETKIGRSAHE